jgi:cyclic-di-AMP phosphodiesterase PgpH
VDAGRFHFHKKVRLPMAPGFASLLHWPSFSVAHLSLNIFTPILVYIGLGVAWLWFSFPTLPPRQRSYYIMAFLGLSYAAFLFSDSSFLYPMILTLSGVFTFCTYVVDAPRRTWAVLLATLGLLLLLPTEVNHNLWVLWFMSVSLQNYFFYTQGVVKARGDIIKSTFFWGAIVAINLVLMSTFYSHLTVPTFIVLGGFTTLVPFFMSVGLSPVLEYLFTFLSSLTLLELANLDHPLIKRLQVEAPGTFHHSLLLATLSENAADEIRANGLLTRVGCLYHDIGKMRRAVYFVENQAYFGVSNPHDELNPRLSKLIVASHPADGLKMAEKHRLPYAIRAFIPEHHGTLLCGYFYHKALKQEDPARLNKSEFRYPGPKPQTRETAIVMLADAAESAVRALNSPTPDQVDSLLEKIFRQRIDDGQFDECPITLKEIWQVKKSFARGLSAIHHQRVNYSEKIRQVHASPTQTKKGYLQRQPPV